jgi:hypothetical protein
MSKYRLYYSDDESPLHYSMEDLPGKFIFVDQNVYQCGRYDVKIVNGKLKSLNEFSIFKYVKVDSESNTTVMTDPTDITLIVDSLSDHILMDYLSTD